MYMEKEIWNNVEVIYICPKREFSKKIQIRNGVTVRQALSVSGVMSEFPEINFHNIKVGIFSKKIELDTVLFDGDRIEIYRPLEITPAEARRLRAAKKI